MPTLRLGMVAGESSGDLLGSRVLRALKQKLPDTQIDVSGIGGPAMQAEGLRSLYPMERLAVMGLVEPLGRLAELLRIRGELRRHFLRDRPDLFIGVDAPDFNLALARSLRRGGVTTAQLVSPTVWAWRPGRVKTVARSVDSLWCLFPFEPPLYAGTGLDARFVGHPLVEELRSVPDRQAARAALGLDSAAPVIALLPGSRHSEVGQLAATFIETGLLLCGRDPRRQLLLPAASAERHAQLSTILGERDAQSRVRLLHGQSRDAMLAADVVILASGTASLEAMLLRRPMVIAYRVAPLSWKLMSRLAVTPYAGLPNVFADAPVVPELLQDDLSAAGLALEAEALLADGGAQVAALDEHRAALERDFDQAVVAAVEAGCGNG